MSEALAKAPKLATKEIAVTQPYGVTSSGLNVLPREDVTLTMLAMSDEREFAKMIRTDAAISGAIKQRTSGLMSKGWSVIEGPSHNEVSGRLKQFAIQFLKTIPLLNVLRREVLESIYYGWRPVELQWGLFEFDGAPMWGIQRAVAR